MHAALSHISVSCCVVEITLVIEVETVEIESVGKPTITLISFYSMTDY